MALFPYVAVAVTAVAVAAQAAPVGPALERPAVPTAAAARSVLQGAAQAGPRLVAVGERGIVVLSDDQGKTWRQVSVPVSVGLTAVRFVDAQHGWITGHGGVVLATIDGGQRWVKQLDGLQAAQLLLKDAQASGDAKALAEAERLVADGADKPFLDAHFFDARHGIVVGAYNLAFETWDGGQRWQPISRRLDNPKALHLYAVRVRGDEVVIVGEQGLVLRSTDRAQRFTRLNLPYQGSFFTAELPGATEIVVAGLRGNAWSSLNGGLSWQLLTSSLPVQASFIASALDEQGRLLLANQAGMVLRAEGRSKGQVLVPTSVKLPPLTGLLKQADGQALALTLAGALPVTLGTPK